LLPALSSRFDVALCCTRGGQANRDWLSAAYPTLEQTTSLAHVLADASIECVVVASPIETHAEIARLALHAGKHVFVEKPLATSAAEAEALDRCARDLDRVLFVGHHYLYHPVFERLQAEVGDVVTFLRLSWRKLGTFDSDLFWNLASHEVSLALALMGAQPLSVELLDARAVVSPCDIAFVRLTFGGDRSAVIDIDRSAPIRDKLVTVLCPGRTLLWHDDSLFELRADGVLNQLVASPPDALGLELDAFAAAVEHRSAFRSDAAHGAAVVGVVERIRSLRPGAA
jgi:predicted dehydrogenase